MLVLAAILVAGARVGEGAGHRRGRRLAAGCRGPRRGQACEGCSASSQPRWSSPSCWCWCRCRCRSPCLMPIVCRLRVSLGVLLVLVCRVAVLLALDLARLSTSAASWCSWSAAAAWFCASCPPLSARRLRGPHLGIPGACCSCASCCPGSASGSGSRAGLRGRGRVRGETDHDGRGCGITWSVPALRLLLGCVLGVVAGPASGPRRHPRIARRHPATAFTVRVGARLSGSAGVMHALGVWLEVGCGADVARARLGGVRHASGARTLPSSCSSCAFSTGGGLVLGVHGSCTTLPPPLLVLALAAVCLQVPAWPACWCRHTLSSPRMLAGSTHPRLASRSAGTGPPRHAWPAARSPAPLPGSRPTTRSSPLPL